ncbi:MAG: hypothetical protein QXW60_04940 [Nitrososphaerota archaeon]
MVLARLIRRLKIILAITETRDIARRYFSLQVMDGAIVGIGLVFGLHISGPHPGHVIARSVSAVMIAMVISGVTGAVISEKAEQEARIKRLEMATLTALKNTLHTRVSFPAIFLVAMVNGLSAIGALFLVSLPYLAYTYTSGPLELGIAASFLTCITLLLATGVVVGKAAGIGTLSTSLLTVAAGSLAALLIIIVELLF